MRSTSPIRCVLADVPKPLSPKPYRPQTPRANPTLKPRNIKKTPSAPGGFLYLWREKSVSELGLWLWLREFGYGPRAGGFKCFRDWELCSVSDHSLKKNSLPSINTLLESSSDLLVNPAPYINICVCLHIYIYIRWCTVA